LQVFFNLLKMEEDKKKKRNKKKKNRQNNHGNSNSNSNQAAEDDVSVDHHNNNNNGQNHGNENDNQVIEVSSNGDAVDVEDFNTHKDKPNGVAPQSVSFFNPILIVFFVFVLLGGFDLFLVY